MKSAAPTLVRVKATHIRQSIPGDCHRCAVALALADATGDTEALVTERDWTFYLVVRGRWLIAPSEVWRFVYSYDGLDRTKTGRARLPRTLTGDLAPFTFEIPSLDDPDYKEECHGCEHLFDPSELDDEGCCEGCSAEREDSPCSP